MTTDILSTSIEPEDIIISLKKETKLKSIYNKILYKRIIMQTAQERELSISDEELQAEADRIRRDKRLERSEDTLAWLSDLMVTVEDWEAGIRDWLLEKKLAKYLFAKEAEKFFVQNKIDYDRILLYQIIVPYDRLARELFYQIEEQEISFYQAAHLYDIDAQRRHRCGYEGEVERWSLKPTIAAAVFGAKLGETIGPLQSEEGYHLFLVEEFLPAELTTYHKQKIQNRMFKEWLDSELNYLLHNSNA
ncbi:peptidylprolyl isomerase [Oscillatoriales cyanobacterium LEGE 11467]|uniref:peptidylprolyl isomerase n=1 Tax=Zarconia navalis LEGE 11467 TaxID=1828826 RepID=A0A928VZS1_9CYAN|nr:peptidylprolyl isomerase [Zarconia navalis]MBE9040670.1 peptidylprolyl isomerase [Zarconia navalis LEGE 11467]